MEVLENITSMGVIDVVFDGRMGLYLYMHHPGQKMDVDSKTKVKKAQGKAIFLSFYTDP